MKPQLLEYLVRACAREVLKQINEAEDTKGAPAPPAAGQGTADQPPIPKEPEASPEQTPDAPPAPSLKGIVFVNPRDKSKLQKLDIKGQDDASIERSLHSVAAKVVGGNVKTALSTMRSVKDAIRNPNSSVYLYIGKYDPNSDELFLMADKSLQVAKDASIPPTEAPGIATTAAPTFNPLQASSDEFAQQLVNKGHNVPQPVNENLKKTIKVLVEKMLDTK